MAISHRAKIAHLKRRDPKLRAVIEGVRLKELTITRGYFEALVEAIVSQQLSVKAADTIFARVAALAPGRKFPTPRQMIAIPAARLRKCGLSKMKVSFIKDLAKKVLDGTVDFEKMDSWTDEEVIDHLTAVKGIGKWTAEMFLIFSLGRDDVFSYGDLGLRNAIREIYGLRKHPTEKKAQALAAQWAPYRSLASRYLWASLKKKPKK